MQTAFIVSREIFNHPIMKNIVDFRLFFLIFGKANHSEKPKHVVNGIYLERGQWFRSTRKLVDDLEYVENNKTLKYSTSVINYSLKRLSKYGMITCKDVGLGTLFTVVNYNRYQDLSNYGKGSLEHSLEHTKNTLRTDLEQTLNNINNVINENNENNENNKETTVVAKAKPKRTKNKEYDINRYKTRTENLVLFEDDVYITYEEYDKLVNKHGKDFVDYMITYYNSNVIQEGYRVDRDYKNDYLTINKWCAGNFGNYKPQKNNSFYNKQEKSDNAIIDFLPSENSLLRLEE